MTQGKIIKKWLGVDNVNSVDIVEDTCENEVQEQTSLFKLNKHQGLNETNLMTLPFIWLKRLNKQDPVKHFERIWTKSNNEIVSIKVVGGEYGVPCIGELDILLALFRIYLKQMNNTVEVVSKVDEVNNIKTRELKFDNKVIHFTYRELAKEIGYKSFGGSIKEKLERGIRTLTETTMYTKYAIFDASLGKHISATMQEESFRIVRKYKGYKKLDYLKENNKTLNPAEIKDFQVIELDDFFFKNLCHGYFKVYDYDLYKKLKLGISKKMFLLLSTWSKKTRKFIKYQTLFNYIGLDGDTKKDIKYNKTQISKALKELIKLGFIDTYNIMGGNEDGIEFIFNSAEEYKNSFKNKYKSNGEIVEKLRLIDISYDEIGVLFQSYDEKTMAGLLRYMDHREESGNTIINRRRYFLTGLKRKYNISNFI